MTYQEPQNLFLSDQAENSFHGFKLDLQKIRLLRQQKESGKYIVRWNMKEK